MVARIMQNTVSKMCELKKLWYKEKPAICRFCFSSKNFILPKYFLAKIISPSQIIHPGVSSLGLARVEGGPKIVALVFTAGQVRPVAQPGHRPAAQRSARPQGSCSRRRGGGTGQCLPLLPCPRPSSRCWRRASCSRSGSRPPWKAAGLAAPWAAPWCAVPLVQTFSLNSCNTAFFQRVCLVPDFHSLRLRLHRYVSPSHVKSQVL